jgi:hypothetical protein
MNMDGKKLANLETKLTQLEIATEKSKTLLSSGKRVAIKRHLDALQTTANEANECRRTVEAFKITNKEELSEIKKWNDDLDLKFEPADAAIQNLEHFLAEAKKAEKFVTHEEELKHEMLLHEKRMEMQAELSSASSSTPKHQKECKESEVFSAGSAKLPKLVIAKFGGSFTDWPKFWGQFSEAIDKSLLAPITKFTYLLELLEPNVKRGVESLPFSPEGYNRAKVILKDKYGKESEIEKCYVKEILDLPNIPGANPRRIANFCDKPTHSVQALETMGKLSNVNGNVSMTLDKLSGIRGDLVRNDPEWDALDFIKLTDAVNQWVKRNPVLTSSGGEREENNVNARKLFHLTLPIKLGSNQHMQTEIQVYYNHKDKTNVTEKHNAIYMFTCKNCPDKYI